MGLILDDEDGLFGAAIGGRLDVTACRRRPPRARFVVEPPPPLLDALEADLRADLRVAGGGEEDRVGAVPAAAPVEVAPARLAPRCRTSLPCSGNRLGT